LAAAHNLQDRAEELGSAAFGRQWGTLLMTRPLLYLGRAEEFLRDLSAVRGPVVVVVRKVISLAYAGRVSECLQGLEELLGQNDQPAGAAREGLVMALEAALMIGDAQHAEPLAA